MYTYPIIDRRSPAAGILDPDPEVGIPGEAGKSQLQEEWVSLDCRECSLR